MDQASRSASVERRNSYRDERPSDNREYGENRQQYKSRSRSIDRSQDRRARSPLPNKAGNVLYVGNLDRRIGDAELRDRFERFGKLESLQLIKDPNTQECRGFAFVEYVNYDDAEFAIKELDQKEFDGRKLRVERSKRGIGYDRTPGQYLGHSRNNYSNRGFRGDRNDRGPRYGGGGYNRDRRSRSRSRSRDRERRYGGGDRNGGGRGYREGGFGDRDRPRGDRYNNDRPRHYRERSRSRERERRY